MWNGYKNYDHYFTVDANGISDCISEISKNNPPVIKKGKIWYWNIPASFDIETSSYKKYGKKYATMYLWALNINGSTIVGRRWSEFSKVIRTISEVMHTDSTRLIIYVHNLGYEFQFMRGWFNFSNVFASKERRPIYAQMENGIEFRCSYLLSNYALAYIGEKLLLKYDVQKDVGALDYSKKRNWLTQLTPEEYWYNVHDVQVVTSFIQEKIENEGGITEIPLTNTGYVRKFSREYCFTQMSDDSKLVKKFKARYHEIMKALQITSKLEYEQLNDAFGGGFTHANPYHSGKLQENVFSMDLASSYPAVMVMKKFPMGRGTFIGQSSISQLDWLTKSGYCAVFTIKIKNLEPTFRWDNYISLSHCSVISKDAVVNNGRVVSADECQLVVTELDFDIIRKTYTWESIEIHNLRVYPTGYLPRPFIMAILHLFGKKTSLKDVKGKEVEYMVSKNMINSAYGMSVTSIIRDIYEYMNGQGWSTTDGDTEKQLSTYNNSYNRFLFYGWGVWVTAHARHNLWDAILECGSDYVYSDTDSIKGLNYEKHKGFFSLYNFNIKRQLHNMCNYYSIPYEKCTPLTVKGEKKIIGVWEREPDYRYFKSIGAKRYIFEYMNGEINFTISGVNKKYGMPYLLNEYAGVDLELAKLAYNPRFDQKEESEKAMEKICSDRLNGLTNYNLIFEMFEESLYFPAEFTGKQTLTYIDDPIMDKFTDFQGHTATIFEYSSIHMEPQGYFMSKSGDYIAFLKGIQDASI